MNQRIGINVSKELKSLRRRAKTPVLSKGNNKSYTRKNSYFYEQDIDMDDYNDEYEDDCFCISNKIKCSSKTAYVVGAGIAVGLIAMCLIRRVNR